MVTARSTSNWESTLTIGKGSAAGIAVDDCVVDEYWMDHIDAMDDLKQGIRLRAYANTDPVIAYKQESLTMFEEMVSAIQTETVRRMFSVRLKKDEEVKRERVAKAWWKTWAATAPPPRSSLSRSTRSAATTPAPAAAA